MRTSQWPESPAVDSSAESAAFCHNEGCPTREVTVRIHENAAEPAATLGLSCPMCRRPLEVHAVRTTDDVEKLRDGAAKIRASLKRMRIEKAKRLGVPIETIEDLGVDMADYLKAIGSSWDAAVGNGPEQH